MKPASSVLIIHNILWSHYKGVVFAQFAHLCKARGFDAYVIHLAELERQRASLGEIDTEVHTYPYEVLIKGALDQQGIVSRVVKVCRAMARRSFDVVVISGYSDASYWAALLIARLRGAKVIVAIDSTAYDHPRRWYRELAKRFFTSACHGAFGYGTRSLEYCRSLGFRTEQVFIRCQATDGETISREFQAARMTRDLEIARLGLHKKNVIFVGRLSPEKNLITALKAFAAAAQSLGDAQEEWGFLVIGDGPDRAKLEEWCSANDVSNVRFLGSRGWKDVPKMFALADIFVLPSVSEPWGLVVNEAMECELPVLVSTSCGSAPDLVTDGENGYTFPPLDVSALSSRLSLLMGDAALRAKLGQMSKSVIQRSTPRIAAEQMLSGIEYVTAR